MSLLRISDNFRGMGKARFSFALMAGAVMGGCNKAPEAKEPVVVEIPPAGRASPLEEKLSMVECYGAGSPPDTKVEKIPEPCMDLAGENVMDVCRGKADYMNCIAENLALKPLKTVDGHYQFVTPAGGTVFRFTVGEFAVGTETSLTVKSITERGVGFIAQDRACLDFDGEVNASTLPPETIIEMAKRQNTGRYAFFVGYNREVTGDAAWLEMHSISNISVQYMGSGRVRVAFQSPVKECE